MKKIIYRYLLLLLLILFGFLIFPTNTDVKQNELSSQKIRSTSLPKAGIKAKKERAEYFYNMLKDPATNKIPKGIRQKELAFAKQLSENSSLNKIYNIEALNWVEAGPNDVGGRTRALAVDVNNPNIIISGGASGGIWKSTDKGATWNMKSTNTQVLSVTCIAQDTRSGHTNTWYYAAGEFSGSAQDQGYTAMFTGAGIYKSTDNGETWNILSNTEDTDETSWNSYFDYVESIIVNPTTGSLFLTSQGMGVLRSTDGGNSFSHILGGINQHIYSDIDIAANGNIVAVISSPFNGVTAETQPGVYKSTNDGGAWTNITPNTFPADFQRSVVQIAPSNNNAAYVLTFTGGFINEKYDDVKFHKINISNGTAEDRSANMPNFDQDLNDYINTQHNYNMVVSVKPDDENFVMIGATSLFRSTNGFSTKPSDMVKDWIGGYNTQSFFYPNFHPDIHSFAYDPTNPNAMWWGHDGGLSYTSDIRTTNYQTYFPWENKNNGYNVTQFYMITIPDEAGDNRIMGGTQDNATPAFRFDGTNATASVDVSSGDGSYCYWGNSFAYSSVQNGRVMRLHYDTQNNPIPPFTGDPSKTYKDITPIGAENQLFINPFAVDPNNEEIMYYLSGNVIWRNNQLSGAADDYSRGTSIGWTKLDNLTVPSGFTLSTLAISQSNPNHRLYYAASDNNQTPGAPKIYKLDNANTTTSGATEIPITGAANGAYAHNIAVNPNNANELMVILSNYNIVGIYHSTNGGASFTAVEGNLEGTQNNPGPSIRGASILPYNGTTRYIVGTSTGIYSTISLNGSSTVWEQEGPSTIGNVIVNYITSRPSDGRIVAGTHGRGAFVSEGIGSSAPVPTTDKQNLTLRVRPGESGSTSFTLGNSGGSTMNYNISVSGDLILAKQAPNNFVLKKTTSKQNLFDKIKSSGNNITKFPKSVAAKSSSSLTKETNILGTDVWYLDDGDANADQFLGWNDGTDLYWYNEFDLSGFDFQLDEIQFFMRTESAFSNSVYLAVYDGSANVISDGYLNFATSTDGQWFSVTLDPVIDFNDGESFYLEIATQGSGIPFPAGVDVDANVINKTFYWDGVNWTNINTIPGFENAAALIRAVGTAGGGGSNQDPVAVANVSPTQANINDMITFNGSSSYDNDGNITTYLWNFGDGTTSNQATVQHSYSQANTYNYSLTVTDNGGATNQATGQVTISQSGSAKVTVVPSSGTINAGGSQLVTLTLDATSVSAGTYVGQVNISTNGGNITIPIDYVVDVEKDNILPTEYSLSQNYPNPFNPSTTIEFAIPNSDEVSLVVYDMLGREVAELVNNKLSAGNYKIQYNAAEKLSSGVYIYRLKTQNYSNTKKLLLIK